MNNWDISPITQTNEVARKFTPKENSPLDCKPSSKEVRNQLLAEDLQKIRRSNHSSHQQHHRQEDAMDDDEHDGIIKGLLYPGLEDSAIDCDFFEDDYHEAQSAVRGLGEATSHAMAMTGISHYASAAEVNHARHRRTALDSFASLDSTMDSYEASFLASMGRPYSDRSHQKLR